MWLLIFDTIFMFLVLGSLYIAIYAVFQIPKIYNRVMDYLGLNPPEERSNV
jgi:hypothetical protein